MRWRSALGIGVLAAIVAAAILVVPEGGGGAPPATPTRLASAAAWNGLVGGARAEVGTGQRVLVVLTAFSLADRVQRAGGLATDAEERRWTAGAAAAQQQFISDVGRAGVAIRPEFRFTRTLNGFSAVLDPRAIALIERTPGVKGVYPVRVAFPASLSPRALRLEAASAARPGVRLAGIAGRGVLIALLDTGVDAATPYLHGHVLPGLDIAGTEPSAQAQAKPTDPSALEEHGTEMAGLLVGAGGPAGVTGVAPAATVLPSAGGRMAARRTGRLRGLLPHRPAARRARAGRRPGRKRRRPRRRPDRARAPRRALRRVHRRPARARGRRRAAPGHPRRCRGRERRSGRPRLRERGRPRRSSFRPCRRSGRRRAKPHAGEGGRPGRVASAVRPPRPPRRRHPALTDTRSLSVHPGPGSLLPARALTGGRPRRGRSRRRGSGHDRPSCCGCRRGRRDPARPACRARRHRSRPPHRYPGGRAPARGHACVAYRARSNGRDRRPATERRSPDDRGALLVVGACVRRRDQAGSARAGRRTGDRRPGCRSGRRLRLRDGQRLERRRRGGRGRGCAPGRGQARCERGEDSSAARRRGQAARPGSCGRPGGGHARRRPLGRAGARRRPVPSHLRPRDGRGLARGRGAPAPQRLGPQAHGLRRRRPADATLHSACPSSPVAPRSSRARSPGSPSTFRRSRSPAAKRRSGL